MAKMQSSLAGAEGNQPLGETETFMHQVKAVNRKQKGCKQA
jgi:hypothetical protein